jgi:hypothetical protein
LRRLWEVKNGGSVKLTMNVDARPEDYVCVCVWMLGTVVVLRRRACCDCLN